MRADQDRVSAGSDVVRSAEVAGLAQPAVPSGAGLRERLSLMFTSRQIATVPNGLCVFGQRFEICYRINLNQASLRINLRNPADNQHLIGTSRKCLAYLHVIRMDSFCQDRLIGQLSSFSDQLKRTLPPRISMDRDYIAESFGNLEQLIP